jgi:hypothetical protein
VGATDGDSTSPQFWVDAQRWRVLRVIQREPRQPTVISDLRFLDYTEILEVPVPTRIQVRREGRVVDEFRYTEFIANPALSRRSFDLRQWRMIGR